MTATIVASGTTVQGDGGGDGKGFTTGTVSGSKWLIVATTSSANADVIAVPGTGTWAEITLPDNVVLTGGGQIRLWKCINPASTTTYTFTLTGGRRTLGWALVDAADATNCVDVASSLESASGGQATPPSAIPNAASEFVMDFAFMRCFSPDVSNWSPPSTGLTWTEVFDSQGADGNNNCRLALGTATAGSSGVAVSVAKWTNTDVNEESMLVRLLIKSAAGGSDATATPTTVHGVGEFPAATVSAGSTVAPATVAGVGHLPAPTTTATTVVSPATVSAVGSFPAATTSAGSTAAPATVSGVGSLPSPTLAAGSTAAPATVSGVGSLPTPTPAAGSTAAPATVSGVGSLPAPSVVAGGSATATPATVAGVGHLPAPTAATGSTAAPATVSAIGSLPAPSVSGGAGAAPSTVHAVGSVPAPVVAVDSGATAAPATLSGAGHIPQPGVSTGNIPRAETVLTHVTETPRQHVDPEPLQHIGGS